MSVLGSFLSHSKLDTGQTMSEVLGRQALQWLSTALHSFIKGRKCGGAYCSREPDSGHSHVESGNEGAGY